MLWNGSPVKSLSRNGQVHFIHIPHIHIPIGVLLNCSQDKSQPLSFKDTHEPQVRRKVNSCHPKHILKSIKCLTTKGDPGQKAQRDGCWTNQNTRSELILTFEGQVLRHSPSLPPGHAPQCGPCSACKSVPGPQAPRWAWVQKLTFSLLLVKTDSTVCNSASSSELIFAVSLNFCSGEFFVNISLPNPPKKWMLV